MTITSPTTNGPLIAVDEQLELISQLEETLNKALKGKTSVVRMVLVCLLSRGHLLIEDKPGLGKTTLAKALAAAISGHFARVQCTPDLLPSDITGFNIFNQKDHSFEFRKGPVFSDICLADEINRATPRTQSALLEAMAERQVTIDTHCHKLPPHFFVIATQNPSEQHGTFPLPEAQCDRFSMKLSIGYPGQIDEVAMLNAAIAKGEGEDSTSRRDSPLDLKTLAVIQNQVEKIEMKSLLLDYMVRFAKATREHPGLNLGISPRGLLIWQRTAQATAYLARRSYVIPEDLQETALPVLSVRLGFEYDEGETLLEELLRTVPLPEFDHK
ncbi:ATPase RavA [Polystyrenella longa]|uniref:ATPase RavA n=1 Tax=Polystyrenella longa TaxID=2528007 RepID=A0A518CTB3_9PLAN|nr:MoxR family ATPase [Polystyrenella longa]QDU82445.1 ATPase RavA [Polystyrenella longa]